MASSKQVRHGSGDRSTSRDREVRGSGGGRIVVGEVPQHG